ncbi:MAG TPA: IclR family transcriptional regulator [Candidatus Limnocylindria bacterium]|nr:IclR family transcriptional regulator [Candidatus Limnocylindria bacterium]
MVKEVVAVRAARERRSVQSVERALDLLEALASADGEVSITSLASRTSLHVSTAHRLLATLLRRGYVRQNPDTSRYYAGAKLTTLAEGRSRYGELRLRARGVLRELAASTRETVNLSVLDDTAAVYIDTVPSPQPVRLFTSVGNRVPLHATGSGKALLAWLAPQRRDALLERLDLRRHTAHTLVERDTLRFALDEIRARGFAIDDEEFDEGVRCVAVPVGPLGAPLAAISVSGPAHRLAKQRCAELAPVLRRCAGELETALRERTAP